VVGVSLVSTPFASEAVPMPDPDGPAPATGLGGVGGGNLLESHARPERFIGGFAFKPEVAVQVGFGLGRLPLFGLSDARQVLHADAAAMLLGEGHQLLADDVVDVPDGAGFLLFQALQRFVLALLLQPAPFGGVAAADMPDPAEAQEQRAALRRDRYRQVVLSPVHPDKPGGFGGPGNFPGHRNTGVPDPLLALHQLEGARPGFPPESPRGWLDAPPKARAS